MVNIYVFYNKKKKITDKREQVNLTCRKSLKNSNEQTNKLVLSRVLSYKDFPRFALVLRDKNKEKLSLWFFFFKSENSNWLAETLN